MSVRLKSGKRNSSLDLTSASIAWAPRGTRSPSAPTCASRIVGSATTAATLTLTHSKRISQRARTVAFASRVVTEPGDAPGVERAA